MRRVSPIDARFRRDIVDVEQSLRGNGSAKLLGVISLKEILDATAATQAAAIPQFTNITQFSDGSGQKGRGDTQQQIDALTAKKNELEAEIAAMKSH